MEQLKILFVPYEQALELKELGFNEPCLGHYQDRDETTMHGAVATSKNVYFFIGETNKGFIVRNSPISNCVLAPTFSQVFRWFREKYNLFGCIDLQPAHWFVRIDDKIKNHYLLRFETYEEAELDCLKKLIEIAKTKTK